MLVSGMRSFVRGLWLPLATVVALELLGLAESAVGLLMAVAGIGTLTALPASRLLVGRHSLLAIDPRLTLFHLPAPTRMALSRSPPDPRHAWVRRFRAR
jgi:hypothetical protein